MIFNSNENALTFSLLRILSPTSGEGATEIDLKHGFVLGAVPQNNSIKGKAEVFGAKEVDTKVRPRTLLGQAYILMTVMSPVV